MYVYTYRDMLDGMALSGLVWGSLNEDLMASAFLESQAPKLGVYTL